jgi:hypothetical protein
VEIVLQAARPKRISWKSPWRRIGSRGAAVAVPTGSWSSISAAHDGGRGDFPGGMVTSKSLRVAGNKFDEAIVQYIRKNTIS